MINKELAIKIQFLEEANDHINTIEILLEVREDRIDVQHFNKMMRAAHSIKGGAAMMGFDILSELAHQLENVFKVIKIKQDLEININLQSLLLSIIDNCCKVISFYRNENSIDIEVVVKNANLAFQKLHEILGDTNYEDTTAILTEETNLQDIIHQIFQTQVEDCLQRLELLLLENHQGLREEVMIMANELGALGQMLQIEAFTELCESIITYLTIDNDTVKIASTALQAWRRSQALILTNQINSLPKAIDWNSLKTMTLVT